MNAVRILPIMALRLPVAAAVLLVGVMALNGCNTPPQIAAPTLPPTPAPIVGAPAQGQAIFAGAVTIEGFVACRTCHTADVTLGDSVGPNLAGVALRAGTRIAGTTAEEYLRASIENHNAYVVEGFSSGMVAAVVGREFGAILDEQQIAHLVSYLQTLDQQPVAPAVAANALPTPSPGVTASTTPGPDLTASATPGPDLTASATPGPDLTASATSSPAVTASATPSASPSAAPSPSPTSLPSPSAAPSPSPTSPSAAPSPTAGAGEPSPTTVPTELPPTAVPTEPPLPTATPLPPTATPPPAPTPTPPPPPTATPAPPPPAEPTPVPPVPDDPNLAVNMPCVNCHNLHPNQVQMPHPLHPPCSECHSGSPNRIGCPSCHSMHQVEGSHPFDPNMPCEYCHTGGTPTPRP